VLTARHRVWPEPKLAARISLDLQTRCLRGKICVVILTSIRVPGPQGFNLAEGLTIKNQAIENTVVIQVRKWWNWQTHHLEGVAPKGVGVQIPPSAPILLL
jgi:hypothetical protein